MRGWGTGVILLVAAVLAGCTQPAGTGGDGPSPTAISSAVAVPPTDATQPSDPVESDGCADPRHPENCVIVTDECHPWEFAGSTDAEQVAGWKLQVAEDSGPREFAMGEAVLDETGTPVAYIVASGDIPDFVSERFCVNLAYLNSINSVRRTGALTLYVGDTLNLDAHTIFTVGDQNGVVYDGDPPNPMPPQR